MGIRVLAGLTLGALYGLSGAQTAAKPLRADRVVLLKKERTLQLYSQGTVIKTYKVALGGDALGPKTRQGDHKTPEGIYVLDSRNAHSQFYKSIHFLSFRGREQEKPQPPLAQCDESRIEMLPINSWGLAPVTKFTWPSEVPFPLIRL